MYICVGKSQFGFCAVKRAIRFAVGKHFYEIIEEGNVHYLITPDNRKIKVNGFTINTDLVVVTVEEPLDGWAICKSIDELG